ncbi:MAG TPA: hypothetical protein VGQ46_17605 [Thermoanaerobaculia bacterium]|nr:hypothetical protein [Thermoanaerobaculia bacterium]
MDRALYVRSYNDDTITTSSSTSSAASRPTPPDANSKRCSARSTSFGGTIAFHTPAIFV